jgi:hypothetical protein
LKSFGVDTSVSVAAGPAAATGAPAEAAEEKCF